VSYPRSGHHWLVNILSRVYGDEFSYCEYYRCCCRTPCAHGAVFQKNHDFDLKLTPERGKTILQVRSPLDSIFSYFHYYCSWDLDKKKLANVSWSRFALEAGLYWGRFARKWIALQRSEAILTVGYQDLVEEPARQMERVLNFLEGNANVRVPAIPAALKRYPALPPKKPLQESPLFSDLALPQIERACAAEIAALGLPRYFAGSASFDEFEARVTRQRFRYLPFPFLKQSVWTRLWPL
jgi:hypothetical protein